jgi:hypothetical protein
LEEVREDIVEHVGIFPKSVEKSSALVLVIELNPRAEEGVGHVNEQVLPCACADSVENQVSEKATDERQHCKPSEDSHYHYVQLIRRTSQKYNPVLKEEVKHLDDKVDNENNHEHKVATPG